ncbi:hypothetical protein [Rugosimonospora africana]|uniref:Uncharacterized protein n=1 Tax=Rugosimonospora africana TaxID=556532 RepID=A0A8J3QPJ9_9ACTN|nr:hypothetical protein [Rugosimonospora africana]GIH15090.1 hypothetical protein Raf01_32620 [Rugosimonospora africana]
MFNAYTILLMLSGLLLVVLGAAVSGQGTGSRVLSILIGVAFFGYGFYLAFIFTGGEYRVFYYAFVVPFLVIFRIVSARRANKARMQAPASTSAPVYPRKEG